MHEFDLNVPRCYSVLQCIGSGKTSLCASLRIDKARFAKDTRYPNEDLTETKFMSQHVVPLKKERHLNQVKILRGDDGEEDEEKSINVYEWTKPRNAFENKDRSSSTNIEAKDTIADNIVIPTRNEELDEVHIYDLGGHNEYTLLNTLSLTPKSLIIVMFRSCDYFSHEESYHQTIGCYLDIVLSKTSDCAILIVASRYDEVEVDDNHFLMANHHKELKTIFSIAKQQLKERLAQKRKKQNEELPAPKLISCEDTGVFLLSNKYEQ